MLTKQQKEAVLEAMKPYMRLDDYGRTTIRNLYYDTDDYLLIRRSIEKPIYKEKLRIRSYSLANAESKVFVELKKKFKSVVYKRRIRMPLGDALAWTCERKPCTVQSQIAEEIDYVLDYYATLQPKVYISYEREAYFCPERSDFRVTFDDNILCRQEALTLEEGPWGTSLLPDDKVLMEIKCSGGMPMWMTELLSREHIFKTSFSKYGTAYKTIIYPKLKEEKYHELRYL